MNIIIASYRAIFIIFSTYSLFTPYSCSHTHVYYHAERINQMTLSGLKLNLLGAMLLELLLKWLMPPLACARRPLASLCEGPWAGHELSIPGTQRKVLRAGGYSALRCGSLVASNPSEQRLRQKTRHKEAAGHVTIVQQARPVQVAGVAAGQQGLALHPSLSLRRQPVLGAAPIHRGV